MILIKGISKSFGKRKVLKSITLDLAARQTHVLLGSSGSGKSTLLRMLIGLIQPDSGQVFLDGTEMTPLTQRALARKVGYVIQEGGLFPHLSAADNVTLAARAFGLPRKETQEKLSELARLVGFKADILKRYPKQLSGGQRQRVSLMRALLLDPSILLLDEPLGALDPIVRSDLQNELQSIFTAVGKTVVLVTHDINEAAFFGNTITLLNGGQIEQHGTFEALAKKPASTYVTQFLEAQKPSRWLKEFL